MALRIPNADASIPEATFGCVFGKEVGPHVGPELGALVGPFVGSDERALMDTPADGIAGDGAAAVGEFVIFVCDMVGVVRSDSEALMARVDKTLKEKTLMSIREIIFQSLRSDSKPATTTGAIRKPTVLSFRLLRGRLMPIEPGYASCTTGDEVS